jgi:hypothetical protein
VEKPLNFKELMESKGLDVQDLVRLTGYQQSRIYDLLRKNDGPERLKEAVMEALGQKKAKPTLREIELENQLEDVARAFEGLRYGLQKLLEDSRISYPRDEAAVSGAILNEVGEETQKHEGERRKVQDLERPEGGGRKGDR